MYVEKQSQHLMNVSFFFSSRAHSLTLSRRVEGQSIFLEWNYIMKFKITTWKYIQSSDNAFKASCQLPVKFLTITTMPAYL